MECELKVLLIDHSKIVGQRISEHLLSINNVNYLGQVISKTEAIEKINIETPDAVLLEINLPEYNGLELLLFLHHMFPIIKIIVHTDLNSDQYRERCLTFGAHYFLDKNQDIAKIETCLNEISVKKVARALLNKTT